MVAGERLSATVTRVLAPNPSLMTLSGTNTYLVGEDELVVIDPGPDLPEHLEAIVAAAARLGRVGRRTRGIARAWARRPRSRSSASSRLRAWPRASWATATSRGPTRAMTRRFCSSVSVREAATSKEASTREAVTFAC